MTHHLNREHLCCRGISHGNWNASPHPACIHLQPARTCSNLKPRDRSWIGCAVTQSQGYFRWQNAWTRLASWQAGTTGHDLSTSLSALLACICNAAFRIEFFAIESVPLIRNMTFGLAPWDGLGRSWRGSVETVPVCNLTHRLCGSCFQC